MSYVRKRNRRPIAPPETSALGDLASTITNLASGIGIAADLATDPYLPETVCRVGQLSVIRKGGKPGVCANTAMNLSGGVGLRKMVKPLRAYVYAEQHRWVYLLAVAGIVGVPLFIGYTLGKGGR